MPTKSKSHKTSFPTASAPQARSQTYTSCSLVPYCQQSMPPNVIDPGEFYMTDFHAPNGANHFPYYLPNDNIYSSGTDSSFRTIAQCHVDVTRKTGDEYDAVYYGIRDQELGCGSASLNNDGDRF
jgi:hypothetical protein